MLFLLLYCNGYYKVGVGYLFQDQTDLIHKLRGNHLYHFNFSVLKRFLCYWICFQFYKHLIGYNN